MSLLLDAFWRAVAYCLHPRVIAFSMLPLILMVVLSFALGYLFWDAAVASVMEGLQSLSLVQAFFGWLERIGMEGLRTVLAPLLVLIMATPVIVLCCLLLVAVFMTPAMVSLVGRRRFPELEKKRGGSLLVSILWSVGSTLLALLVLVLSMPLWLIPPLVLILPPLIWGWLTYRVFAFDALAERQRDERRQILGTPRHPAAYGHAQRLPGCGAQLVVGVGRHVHCAGTAAGAGGHLDLHPGVRFCLAVVCPLRSGRVAENACRPGHRGAGRGLARSGRHPRRGCDRCPVCTGRRPAQWRPWGCLNLLPSPNPDPHECLL
jgi:hypothetical protein